MYYFAYGSNMSSRRIQARSPSAAKLNTAVLTGHRLAFHKISDNDGTAKCDACETGEPEDCVHGVVFAIVEQDKPALDRAEGLGRGYAEKVVQVRLTDGEVVEAITYYAIRTDPALKPLDWYKSHVLRGAREHGLPEAYIRAIESVEHIEDTDGKRRERELSIYR
ncbi:gamma-glutamylcyclotransferase family protein [Thiohalophilus thiocyanatoxydans]|uniref:Cation transport regulator ChaC n=1 Tax=Thiohalophilus thiocyanatoxydans TaxID=381308 RepID=A0A4R8IMK9_9GAMM|nr:gamma-glutamylcyclotransferase family protein [Thiohalophilus thiocyanatoxydans]TDX97775.1 cation transport regulator ChaC [Thiohalophilus thiocyanatoxydans]